MATLDVLDAVRDVADTVVAINSAYKNWPEKPPTGNLLPAAIVSLDREREAFIELSAHERWEWPVRIDILVARAGDIKAENEVVIPILESFIAATRGHANLYGFGAFHADVTWQLATLSAYDTIYTGLIIQTTVEQHFEVAAQYGN